MEQKAHGEPIGGTDNNDVPLKAGDYMDIKHNCDCVHCSHYDIVQILWNEDWKTYGIRKASDGQWLGKASSANGFIIQFRSGSN